MARPVTIFTGQWADLSFSVLCTKMAEIGYDGLEIACWGDHLDVRQAAENGAYLRRHREILEEHKLGCWALGAHLTGQCVGDAWDERLDTFAPASCKGDPEKIRAWAVEEMKIVPWAAKAMGCGVVTCFMGSPVWRYWYSFPPTTERMLEEGYRTILERWTPILDEFDRAGVRFALEVHPTEIAFDFYTAKRLLEVFGERPTLGFNFDPSHLFWQGMRPELFLRDFASRIYHVHMKDVAITLDGRSGILGSHLPFGDLRRGWNFRSLGHGHVDFDAVIRELNAVGYQGPLSVEWEDNGMEREFGARESLAFVRRMNFAPSSVAFDGSMEN